MANVSEMTASRVMRSLSDVSEKTRQRVEDAAASVGYVPNRIAGALASRTVNLVGVVIPSLSSLVFGEVLSGISAGLADSQLQPVIGVSGYDLKDEENVIRDMLSWRPAGLIIAGLEHTEAARKMLRAADIPIVEVMDTDGHPVDHCVGISHRTAGHDMAKTITARGYRNIGFIGSKLPQDYRAQKRLDGFTDHLESRDMVMADREHYTGASSIAKGRELTSKLLVRSPQIDCIYYSSDVMSVGGLMHCLSNGLSVPADIALAGFNRLDLLNGLPIELATTDSFRFEIGKTAAELVLDKNWRDKETVDRTIVLKPRIELGESL